MAGGYLLNFMTWPGAEIDYFPAPQPLLPLQAQLVRAAFFSAQNDDPEKQDRKHRAYDTHHRGIHLSCLLS